MSLIELAIAFVVNHPAVTSAIIGPRTMEQLESQLPAADVDARRGGARPHRRDRPPRREPQPGRHQLRRAGARPGAAATLAALTPVLGRRPPVSGYFASSAMVLSKLPTRPGKSNSGNWESDSTGKWSS